MGSARTLKRRRQREAAKTRPPRPPLTPVERWLIADYIKIIRRHIRMNRYFAEQVNRPFDGGGATIRVPNRFR
jgi:hypothetical protein